MLVAMCFNPVQYVLNTLHVSRISLINAIIRINFLWLQRVNCIHALSMRYIYFLCFCLLFIAVDYLVHLNCCIMLRIIIFYVINYGLNASLIPCVGMNSQLREFDIDVELLCAEKFHTEDFR